MASTFFFTVCKHWHQSSNQGTLACIYVVFLSHELLNISYKIMSFLFCALNEQVIMLAQTMIFSLQDSIHHNLEHFTIRTRLPRVTLVLRWYLRSLMIRFCWPIVCRYGRDPILWILLILLTLFLQRKQQIYSIVFSLIWFDFVVSTQSDIYFQLWVKSPLAHVSGWFSQNSLINSTLTCSFSNSHHILFCTELAKDQLNISPDFIDKWCYLQVWVSVLCDWQVNRMYSSVNRASNIQS